MAIAELRHIAAPKPSRPQAGRDTGIDLVRAFCVLGVVVLHSLMVGVTVVGGNPVFANASDGSAWITPLSWVLQIMPLFFVIGGFAGYTSFIRSRQRGGTANAFVAARIHRLLLPAVCTVAVVGVSLTALLLSGVPGELVVIAGYRFGQPLWFLGVFLLCQTLLPALAVAHERAPWRTIALLVAAAIVIDALRITTGADAFGILNLAFVWLALQQLGFFLADGRISALARRTRAIIAGTAVTGLVLACITGVYSPDLIANINPPTTALLFVGVAHTMLMSLLRERLNTWSNSPFGSRLRGFVTPRAMTIYLWHMPILLAMAGISAMLSITTGIALPEPSSFAWWITRPLWLAVVFVLTAAVATVLASIEARPAPIPTDSSARLVAATAIGVSAVVGLLVLGATPLTTALAVVLMLSALRLARVRTIEGRGSDSVQPGSAPWPSRSAGIMASSTTTMANANTSGNASAPPPSVATPSPAMATATAEPVASEIDSADELNPAFPGAEYARVSTVSRGYSSPIPAPAKAQPRMMTNGLAPVSAVRITPTKAIRRSRMLISAMRLLPSTSPYRPWTAEPPAQANAESIKAIPAQVGVKPNSAMSRYGMYASAAKKPPATSPRTRMTLGSPGTDRNVPFGSRGTTAKPMTIRATSASGQPHADGTSADKPTATAPTATTMASSSRRVSPATLLGSPPPRSSARSRTAIRVNAITVRAATPRKAHRQSKNSAIAPARNGPIIAGITQAAAKAAKIRPCRCGGYSRETTTYSATVSPPAPSPCTSRPMTNCSIVNAKPEMRSPRMNNDTAA